MQLGRMKIQAQVLFNQAMKFVPTNVVCLENKQLYCTKSKLMKTLQLPKSDTSSKVTVVGIGQVGMACAFRILAEKLTTDLCLVDGNADKLMGETYDLLHGISFLGDCKIKGSTEERLELFSSYLKRLSQFTEKCMSDCAVLELPNSTIVGSFVGTPQGLTHEQLLHNCRAALDKLNYKDSANSKICIITAGVRQREGESRLALVQRNVEVMKNIIPPLVKYSPKAIYIIVSNPVDVLTYVAWRLSGLPSERVIGSGTNLDSSRFRYFLSNRLGIAPANCHGWIIGEHGDSSVAVWSGVNVCGIPLIQLNPKFGTPEDPEKWYLLHRDVIQSAYQVIKLKGYTSWATGLTMTAIVQAILKNMGRIHTVSTLVKGYHGIEEDAYLSLPVILTSEGVTDVIIQSLTKTELASLQKSAKILVKVQAGIKL